MRRILWNALKRDRAPLRSYAEGAKLGVPIGLAVKTAAPIVAAAARMNSADDEAVRADLAALPGQLQRVDDWIAEGVLGARSAERGRPPDRRQPSPGDDPGRPAAGDRGASRRRDGAARHPRLSGPRASGAPARLARAAASGADGRQAPSRALQRAHPLDRLPGPELRQRRREPRAVGQRQLGVELEQRLEHEAATRHLRVGQRQPVGLELQVAEQQQVQVERARAMPLPAEHPPLLDLDRLAEIEQVLGLQLGADPDRGVQEVGLVEDLPTGSVSYSEEIASTSTPCSRSAATAARRWAARSPTLEPRPR